MDEITLQKNRIQAAVRDGRVTKAQLSRASGLRDTVLIGIENPSWNPKARTLAALVRAMNSLGFPRRLRQSRNGESCAA